MFNAHNTNGNTEKDSARPDRYDKAIQILQNTHDGGDLSGYELWIVQEAVNNHLNFQGWAKFNEIYLRYVPSYETT